MFSGGVDLSSLLWERYSELQKSWQVVRDVSASGTVTAPAHKYSNSTQKTDPILMVHRYTLQISGLSLRDFAQYRCSGSNKLGSASATITLVGTLC